MEQIKKLAIVIPAYKGRFLKETLDSIAVQAHKDEFVLYIGDDASPERLDKIVESYQNKVNLVYHRFVSIRPRACFFPLFSFLPLWLHYNLNPLCVQY